MVNALLSPLQNQESSEEKSCFMASGTRGLPSLFRLGLTFYSKVKYAPHTHICMGKMLKNHFLKMYQKSMACESLSIFIK